MKEYEYLVKEYTPLIKSIASKFNNLDKEELFQAGVQGLIKAFNNFDETRNTKFSTYAYNDIYGEMYKLIYLNNELKITRDTLRLYKRFMNISLILSQKLNRVPTNEEIAKSCNVDEQLVSATIMSLNHCLSLDAQNDEGLSYIDIISNDESLSIDDKIFLQDAIATLPEPEKSILKYRYYQDLSQKQTASILGISQVKVSRYEQKGIEKMRVYARK